jgi:hypothetical protein
MHSSPSIMARQIKSLQEYINARRSERKVRMSDIQKRGIWQVYETFQRQLKYAGVETWEQARGRAELLVLIFPMTDRLRFRPDSSGFFTYASTSSQNRERH